MNPQTPGLSREKNSATACLLASAAPSAPGISVTALYALMHRRTFIKGAQESSPTQLAPSTDRQA